MTDPVSSYHANGKLLLSGEYFVLHGAKALALPLKMGQQLRVYKDNSSKNIRWKAFYGKDVWFWCELNSADFSVIQASDPEKAATLGEIFQALQTLKPRQFPSEGTRLETFLEADPKWGFGSSSTMISLISQWAEINPFDLNRMIFSGSGFDIACATANGPILYTKNHAPERVDLDYPFADQLMLVYSGKKKNTLAEVQSFLNEGNVSAYLIQEVSDLADEFARCHDQKTFNQLIGEHEKIVSSLIGKARVKNEFFSDFMGEVKSLGAWGGDFYLASGIQGNEQIKKYFENKGFSTIFRWADLILKP